MPAEMFIGRYRVDRRLGEGGMGTVYLAHDENIDRYVAIKVMRSDSDDLLRRFRTEAKAAGRLKHPNIVTIYDFAVFDGVPCLIMEYVEGETLARIIARNDALSLTRKVELMQHVCGALAFAHRSGIVHRDIKPANLMIERDGTIKILDFGIARTAAGSGTTGHIVGTVAYMSPEQALGRPVDYRSDIWALGLVLFEFITGRLAFAGDSDYSVLDRIVRGQPEPFVHEDAAVVAQLKPIVTKALAKEPADRYQNADLMAADLGEARRKLVDDQSGSPTVFLRGKPAPPPQVREIHQPSNVPTKTADVTPPRRVPPPPQRDSAADGTGVPRKFWAWAIPGVLALAAALWIIVPPQPKSIAPADPAPPRAVEPTPSPAPPPVTQAATNPDPEPTPKVAAPDEGKATAPDTTRAREERPVDTPRPPPPSVDYSARLAAARDAFETGDYATALQRYEAVLRDAPDHTDATRGVERVRAAQAAERKLFGSGGTSAASQNEINARLTQARGRFEEGDYDAAISAYEEVLKLDSRNARALSGIAAARKAKAAEDAILKRPAKKPGV